MEIYENSYLFPMGIPSLEQVKHAKVMHQLAETIVSGYETYFTVLGVFDVATDGEFIKHYLEVKNG